MVQPARVLVSDGRRFAARGGARHLETMAVIVLAEHAEAQWCAPAGHRQVAPDRGRVEAEVMAHVRDIELGRVYLDAADLVVPLPLPVRLHAEGEQADLEPTGEANRPGVHRADAIGVDPDELGRAEPAYEHVVTLFCSEEDRAFPGDAGNERLGLRGVHGQTTRPSTSARTTQPFTLPTLSNMYGTWTSPSSRERSTEPLAWWRHKMWRTSRPRRLAVPAAGERHARYAFACMAALIAIAPVGTVEPRALERLTPVLHDAFAAEVVVTPAVPLAERAWNAARRQHLSTAILDDLARLRRDEWERLLGICDVDLYVPELNFVFGEAARARRVAVFSLWRLRSSGTGARAQQLFERRAATEAIHELGHTYGLDHCDDPRCVMWFSNTLAETDHKGTAFCSRHATALGRARAHA
jgi:archaemetzincin